MLLLAAPKAASAAYTPPGALAALVEEKRREVDRLRSLPEAREDGPWFLRLSYPAADASYSLGRALGWRPERPALLVDIKRASPTGQLGRTVTLNPQLVVEDALRDLMQLGVDGALINTDLTSYGGSYRDLKAASAYVRTAKPDLGAAVEVGAEADSAFPIVCKDLIVDPLQIARAACEGARAVVLIAAACLPDLPQLLDTCTLLGVEALVEVHTPDEVTVAAECGASIILVNERDRATGEVVLGQAAGIAPFLPPDATCLAGGGIARIDQVRKLRRAGYDGFVIGRALYGGDPRDAEALARALSNEPPLQRWGEAISVPVKKQAEADAAADTQLQATEPPAPSAPDAIEDDGADAFGI